MKKSKYFVLCSSKVVPSGQVASPEIWVGVETDYDTHSEEFNNLAIEYAHKLCPSVRTDDWVVSEVNGPFTSRAEALLGVNYGSVIEKLQKAAEPLFAALKETGYKLAIDTTGDYELTAIPSKLSVDDSEGLNATEVMSFTKPLSREHLVTLIDRNSCLYQ
jgi:hypothetical protein